MMCAAGSGYQRKTASRRTAQEGPAEAGNGTKASRESVNRADGRLNPEPAPTAERWTPVQFNEEKRIFGKDANVRRWKAELDRLTRVLTNEAGLRKVSGRVDRSLRQKSI